MDQDELRRKFGAMVSSAILNDSHAASGGSSVVAVLPSTKAALAPKARADANVRFMIVLHRGLSCASFYSAGCGGLFCEPRLILGQREQKNLTLSCSM